MLAPKLQRGFLLPFAIVLMVAAASLVVVISYLVTSSTHSSVSHVSATKALFIAESALARGARAQLSEDFSGGSDSRIDCSSVTGNVNLTNISLNGGVYTLTADGAGIAYYNGGSVASPAVTSLSANLTASATVIPINAASAYPSSGRVIIDHEVIDYSGIETVDNAACGGTAPCLLGVRRGRDSSVASSHTNGTRVGQYQCNLRAQAGVSDLTTPTGTRTLTEGVQLQEAWAVGAVAAGGATGVFNEVHCIAANNCWAVGENGVIAQYGGASWSNVTSPTGQNINDVFCNAVNDCWAVADRSGNNFVYVRWNGTSWSTVTLNSSNRQNLNGIHCTASNNCWAVGNRRNNRFIITRWNGTNWSDASILDPPGPISEVNLNAVYCVTTNDCWAVGARQGNYFSFVYWDGATWTASRLNSSNRAHLNGVYCTASNNCWAVGQARNNRLIILSWNGTAWSDQSFNPPGNSRDLNEVFCANVNDCWAVADRDGNNFVFARWNGSSWSKYTVLDAANRENLFGVHCNSTTDCWATGRNDIFSHWDGTNWSVIGPAPSLQRLSASSWNKSNSLMPAGVNELNRVSMLSYADGWAVGNNIGGNATIVRWTGSNWISVPPSPARDRDMEGVFAVSADEAWAVGDRRGCPGNQLTILRWNGASWQCSPGIPSSATVDENMRDIYMFDTDNDGDADDGWAVGDRDGNNFAILRWNNNCAGTSSGTNSWAYCPLNSSNRESLNAIFCVDTSYCWAVGRRRNNRFIIVRWNGTLWSDASVSNPANDQHLNGVYCVTSSDCWAVGNRNGNNFTFLRWDGSSWVLVAVADGANRENLNSIVCAHARDCWAVGNERNNNYTLVHWDGAAWTARVVSGAANGENLNGLALISHRQQPRTAWREIFP